jgi:lipopolysaccharide biosynthesis protein
MTDIKYFTFYLPQYHSIPENDAWWELGFTEWSNVRRATKRFNSHFQPVIPGELGYYDLSDIDIQRKQSELARQYGVDGFVYYSYWFGNGKQLLQKPAEQLLVNKDIQQPFCFCWANETWKGVWFGASQGKTLIEQSYPGLNDLKAYFKYLLPFFIDERYIRINEKPLFIVYIADNLPDKSMFLDVFREFAFKSGLKGLHILSARSKNPKADIDIGFDGIIGAEFSKLRYAYQNPSRNRYQRFMRNMMDAVGLGHNLDFETRHKPLVLDYESAVKFLIPDLVNDFDYHPVAVPNWDNSPRSGNRSMVFANSTPEKWADHLFQQSKYALNNVNPVVFIKSWNEWAEGNYLEPDARYGRSYLEKTLVSKLRASAFES